MMETKASTVIRQIRSKISGLSQAKRDFQTKCWKCGIERKRRSLFCDKCNIIQNPDVKNNYFKVFEIEEKFDVDLKHLGDRYRKLQSVLHPDKFSTKTDEEKNISEEYSSLLNKAYNNLQTPILRAVHLLNLKGSGIEEDQKVEDPAFLMEIMELNEQIDEADTEVKIQELNNKNKLVLDSLTKEIDNAFRSNDIDSAKGFIIKLKYFMSINNRISDIMRDKGIVD